MEVKGSVSRTNRNLGDGSEVILQLIRSGELAVNSTHGKYTEASARGNIFMAHAIVTAPVIYTTAAGTGGPLIWNSSNNKNVNILKVGFGVSVVSTVAASLGLTGNSGQIVAPGSTTAIDSSGNLLIGGGISAVNVYRVGTVTNAGNFFLPFANLHTGALTVDNTGVHWIDIDGLVTVPPNSWCSVASSATASTTVASISIIWEEIGI